MRVAAEEGGSWRRGRSHLAKAEELISSVCRQQQGSEGEQQDAESSSDVGKATVKCARELLVEICQILQSDFRPDWLQRNPARAAELIPSSLLHLVVMLQQMWKMQQ